MGKHSARRHPYEPTNPAHADTFTEQDEGDRETVLFRRVKPAVFWKPEPTYEPPDERPRKAAWALILCSVIVLVIAGGGGYLAGIVRAERTPDVVIHTVTATPSPVTPKRQKTVHECYDAAMERITCPKTP